jgi:hypothetical protein
MLLHSLFGAVAAAHTGVGAAVTRQQIAGSDTGSVTLSQVPVAGNLLLATSYHRATGTTPSITGSSGWTLRLLRTDAPTGQGMAIWSKVAGASEPVTITTTWSPTSANRLVVQEFEPDQSVTWSFLQSTSNVS